MSKRILVVEDQEDNRQIVRDLLTANDYEMTEAENGAFRPRYGPYGMRTEVSRTLLSLTRLRQFDYAAVCATGPW
jgi:CheY-like chemotaxis protein